MSRGKWVSQFLFAPTVRDKRRYRVLVYLVHAFSPTFAGVSVIVHEAKVDIRLKSVASIYLRFLERDISTLSNQQIWLALSTIDS